MNTKITHINNRLLSTAWLFNSYSDFYLLEVLYIYDSKPLSLLKENGFCLF